MLGWSEIMGGYNTADTVVEIGLRRSWNELASFVSGMENYTTFKCA